MSDNCPACGASMADVDPKAAAERREKLVKNLISIRQALYGGSSGPIKIDLGAFGPLADVVFKEFKAEMDGIEAGLLSIKNALGKADSSAKQKASEMLFRLRSQRPTSPGPDLTIIG